MALSYAGTRDSSPWVLPGLSSPAIKASIHIIHISRIRYEKGYWLQASIFAGTYGVACLGSRLQHDLQADISFKIIAMSLWLARLAVSALHGVVY